MKIQILGQDRVVTLRNGDEYYQFATPDCVILRLRHSANQWEEIAKFATHHDAMLFLRGVEYVLAMEQA